MNAEYFSKDIQEFILLLDRFDVKYVIVGGEAVIYYGYPRVTGDIDFFYEVTRENVKRLYEALSVFWDRDIPGIANEEELFEKGAIFQFGLPPNRIDLINRIESVAFKEAWGNKTSELIQINDQTVQVHYIGLVQLIKNKKALGRHKDFDDLSYLEKKLKRK